MNILHVCGTFERGGITSFVKSILELNPVSGTNHDLMVLFDDAKIDVPAARVYSPGKTIGRGPGVFARIRGIIKDYDAIMIHKAHPMVVFPLLFSGKKIFLFQHGMGVSRGSALKRWIKKTWYSLIPVLLNAKIVCSTEFACRKTRRSGIRFSNKRVVILPFGITLKRKTRKLGNPGQAKKEIVVGGAGMFVKIKRFDLLVESLMDYPGDLKIRLKIAGDGPGRESLLQWAARLNGTNAQVELPGYIDDMMAFYDSLDIFVFPSHNESFGLVVLEALARGVPVALFADEGGALSLVENNRNGFVLNEGIAGLRELWAALNNNPSILTDMTGYINKMDLSAYDIKTTRFKLEHLADQV